MTTPLIVEDDNLSVAWAVAFLRLMERGVEELSPLSLIVSGFRDDEPREHSAIRASLDTTLERLKWSLPKMKGRNLCTTQTNANLICPIAWYERADDRHAFFCKFREFYPRLRRSDRLNRSGTYFGRMVDFGGGPRKGKGPEYIGPKDGNQLEHIISNYHLGRSRTSGMVASVFDPTRDHTTQPRRGFPCLNKVTFAVHGRAKDELNVVADYPTQYLFERGYGNYLGLCRLGKFMARELELKLTRFTCTVALAVRGAVPKRELRTLAKTLRGIPDVQAALARQAARYTAGVSEEAYAHAG